MKNQYTVNKDVVKSWTKEFIINGALDVVSIVLTAFVGLCGLFIITLNIIFGVDDWLNLYLGILFIAFSIYRLFFARFLIWNQRYKQMTKIYGVDEWQRTTEFLDDEILLSEHNATNKLQYKNIKRIKEYEDKVFIFFEGRAAIRLYKNAFIDCTWEDCKTFIESKR